MKRRSRIVSSTVDEALMTLHDWGRATLLALAMLLLAGCNEKQVYLPLPPAEVRIAQLILLIALSAKNAILIVGFARDLHLKDGLPLADAAIEAARQRLRPIVMTSLAFILGLLPLVLASGVGANA